MYKPGAILKVTVTNFVTYTYAEFQPGPNLNLVIGPNGTGKSTIVAAIILGLGGNPKIIGRGTKVSEYVKHGCSKALIEILLQGGDEGDFTVTREFDVHDKNVWKLNGKILTFKDVGSYMKQFSIQVDNLCQFLPQDRVQDFAKMNKQELLKQTKKAICREDLLEQQQMLIEKRERHKELLVDLDKQTTKLKECQDMNVRLEGKVRNFNKKKKYLAQVENIDRKAFWVEYEMLANNREEMKEDKKQATEVYQRHSKASKPLDNAIANAKKKLNDFKVKSTNIENNMKTIETKINNQNTNLKQMKDSIAEVLNDMQTKINDIEQREGEINSSNIKLEQLYTDRQEVINKYGNEVAINEKENNFIQEIRKTSSAITAIEQKKDDINSQIREKDYEIRGLENAMTRIENVKQQRLEWLQRTDLDAYNATLWLRENKNRFAGEIFEPMMMEINVTNPEHAPYIENIVAVRDKLAFVCTSKEDMNLFIRLVRDQQHLSVNVIHSGNEHSSFQSYQPAIPIEQLKKYGLYAYIHSLFTGPEPIMNYLCKTYRIHCTPIGNSLTNKCFESVPKEVTTFFSDKFRFSASYSKYTGEKSTRQSEIKSDGSLSVSVDAVQLDQIRNKIREGDRMCENYRGEIQELDNKIIQLSERNSKLTGGLQALRSSQQQIRTIDSRIRMVKDKIQQLKQQATTKESIKQNADKKIQDITKKMLSVHMSTQEAFKNHTDLATQLSLNIIEVNVCRKDVTVLENKAVEVQRLRREAEDTLNHINNLYKDITAKAKAALQKAKNASNGYTPEDDGFQEFREIYDSLPDNLEELHAEKEEVLTKIDFLSTADDGEMKEYEARVAEIKNLETNIDKTNVELNDITSNMDRLKDEYMQPLEELVSEISRNFSAAFESMGCAGEVVIYTGENDKDYEKYGLSIRVTYRNGHPLQELNNITQSGGERAVATATYLLSLQELTPVPFRCVDEINQGMDASNERRIFELLVDSTNKPNTPQYFLITPKLVPNLKFVPSMKVHFVHNGPFITSQERWNAIKIP